ncbi:hypothetical protein AUJ46_04865 [Candidatus Peregrinibacteria bacterium CG1_02_54_53]|nr:MAG: hypothetical protein AUJ46_04865 [Candidatus Peregrinibacteria bacterium CG1_02_54_53]
MRAMSENGPSNGVRDPVVEVESKRGERVKLSVLDADDHIFGGETPNQSKGDSSSCHSDQTLLEHHGSPDAEKETTAKDGIFGQVFVFLRRKFGALLKDEDIFAAAAVVGHRYCSLHPEVLQSSRVDMADLRSFVANNVRQISEISDETQSPLSDRQSDATSPSRWRNRISHIPRKPR